MNYFSKTFHLRCLAGFWIQLWNTRCRYSRPEVFCKKGVLRNFAKFTGKHMCQSFIFNKIAGWHRCFLGDFEKFLKTPFLKGHLWWVLLTMISIKLTSLLLRPFLPVISKREINTLSEKCQSFYTIYTRCFPYVILT